MIENGVALCHFKKAKKDAGRTAENKRINPFQLCGNFPESNEKNKNEQAQTENDSLLPGCLTDKCKLTITHHDSTPSKPD